MLTTPSVMAVSVTAPDITFYFMNDTVLVTTECNSYSESILPSAKQLIFVNFK